MNGCFGCTERHMGCHSDCEKYKGWVEAERQRKDAEAKEKAKQSAWDSYVQESKARYKRRTR